MALSNQTSYNNNGFWLKIGGADFFCKNPPHMKPSVEKGHFREIRGGPTRKPCKKVGQEELGAQNWRAWR